MEQEASWAAWLIPAALAFVGAAFGSWVNIHQHRRDREERATERLWHARVDLYATMLRTTTDMKSHLRPDAKVLQAQIDSIQADIQDMGPRVALLASDKALDAFWAAWDRLEPAELMASGSDGEAARVALGDRLDNLRRTLRQDLLSPDSPQVRTMHWWRSKTQATKLARPS